MTIERTLRGIAGAMILLSLGLFWAATPIDLSRPTWLWLTAFVGLNLLQSSFTNWCPMMLLLRKLGLRSAPDPTTNLEGSSAYRTTAS
jgi:hypothetical protein